MPVVEPVGKPYRPQPVAVQAAGSAWNIGFQNLQTHVLGLTFQNVDGDL
mgnify:FL=1